MRPFAAAAMAGVLGTGLLLPSSPGDEPVDGLVGSSSLVNSVEVPTEAVFRVPSTGLYPGNVVGAVHAIRRIEGGTVLYYSAAWENPPDAPEGRHPSTAPLWLTGDGGIVPDRLVLVSPGTGTAYTPLSSDLEAGPYVTGLPDFNWSQDGELRVLYAVFPELPDEVAEVYVQVGRMGQMVGRPVPVEEGVLEPVLDSFSIEVGSGWPKVPQGDELANADPAAHIFPLYYLTGSGDGALINSEGDSRVVSTLAADVLFAKDSADLSAAARSVLDLVGADLDARGKGAVVVTGHTDSDGTDEYNMDLSRRRAQAVVDALAPLAGSRVTFEVVAKGESEPVADNSTPDGQQANRRVTVAYEVDR